MIHCYCRHSFSISSTSTYVEAVTNRRRPAHLQLLFPHFRYPATNNNDHNANSDFLLVLCFSGSFSPSSKFPRCFFWLLLSITSLILASFCEAAPFIMQVKPKNRFPFEAQAGRIEKNHSIQLQLGCGQTHQANSKTQIDSSCSTQRLRCFCYGVPLCYCTVGPLSCRSNRRPRQRSSSVFPFMEPALLTLIVWVPAKWTRETPLPHTEEGGGSCEEASAKLLRQQYYIVYTKVLVCCVS